MTENGTYLRKKGRTSGIYVPFSFFVGDKSKIRRVRELGGYLYLPEGSLKSSGNCKILQNFWRKNNKLHRKQKDKNEMIMEFTEN